MKGKIKAYSADVNAGLISGEDGRTYRFTKSEWGGRENPFGDERVNFAGETRQAKKITNT
jgi:hypothetical protein